TFNNEAILRGFSNQLQVNTDTLLGYTSGYRPLNIFVTDPTKDLRVLAGETAVFRMVEVSPGINKRPHSQFWSLVGITDATGKALEAYDLVDNLGTRMVNAEENINTLSQNLTIVSEGLNNHVGNQSNPHNVDKEQVGLGNLPNNKYDNPNLDYTNTLATSKAVQALNQALSSMIDAVGQTATNALNNAMPKGAIIMWSGAVENIPTGYVLCDGRPAVNDLNIPDLRNKFIRGASDLANSSGLDPDDRGQTATPAAVGSQGGNN